jgi:TetR/AcrR family transcriptional regulator, cholesterol catabolism regulator
LSTRAEKSDNRSSLTPTTDILRSVVTESRAKHVERSSVRRKKRYAGDDGDLGMPRVGDERWDELLSVAADVFAKKGYKSTSLQDIADRLGMLKGSLYYYINSKEELLYEVIRGVYREGSANLQQLVELPGDGLTKIRRACEGHVVFLIEHLTGTTVLLHEMNMLSPERRAAITGQDKDYLHIVRQLVVLGQEDGSVKPDADPHLTALAIMGAMNWIYRWYKPGGRYSPQQIGRQYADLIESALRDPSLRPRPT